MHVHCDLMHTGHTPGSEVDLLDLPLHHVIREELVRICALHRNHETVQEVLIDFLKVQLPSWGLKYEELDLDIHRRFKPNAKTISNCLALAASSSRLADIDQEGSLKVLAKSAADNEASFVFRGNGMQQLSYKYDAESSQFSMSILANVEGTTTPALHTSSVVQLQSPDVQQLVNSMCSMILNPESAAVTPGRNFQMRI
ncbi:hypothetical protein CYMTET_51661 [Cymbomonas tetramitiformis]|uniref:Uncharacterized protein n=1 Tax=Cymbomonas tetramitiformis TaxID=36881 RepID=A0AAE0BMG6_9CHLO|nr:hypothetical protein CYMTET_51661 [Cymbomonas tetramitiformis]